MNNPRTLESGVRLLRDLESELAEPRIEGIPIGSTLTDAVVIEFINGSGRWSLGRRLMDQMRQVRYRLRARRKREGLHVAVADRILVTWCGSSDRINDLLLPVLHSLGPKRCAVVYGNPAVLPHVPAGAVPMNWSDTMPHDPSVWSAAYRRCWPQWRTRLKAVCHSHGLPWGAYESLSLHILLHAEYAMGCAQYLRQQRPVAILAEHDRSSLSSCMVLAARTLGIPTFTLQHGVLDDLASGYTPILADKMFCWGEFDRAKLVAAGDNPAKLVLGGCPRLSRELSATPAQGRVRLGLDPTQPVVMLGTSPISPAGRAALAELFCRATERLEGVSAVVRLHPSETLAAYADVLRRHPQVRFCTNATATLDEAIAAADVVVVQGSGLGGDALVKRRPVVVVDTKGCHLGHGIDLIRNAGCPRATTADELTTAVRQSLFDNAQRASRMAAAEQFVSRSCCAYGADSAARIAQFVLTAVAREPVGAENR